MRVNSNALLARKMIVTRKFGAEAWNQIFKRLARVHPCLRAPLTASSQVPLAEFLAFNEELVDRLYGADAKATYFDLGEQSAAWAFVDGPCKSYIDRREIGQLAGSFAQIWRAYYTETTSKCEGKVTDDGVEFTVSGLPDWHPYFEYLFTGFMKGAMELVCANPVEATRLRRGSGEFTYLLHTGFAATGRDARIVRRRQRPQGSFVWGWTFQSGARSARVDCEGQNQQGDRLHPRNLRPHGAGSRVPRV